MQSLAVEKRDTSRKPESVRAGGHVPAVLYGRVESSVPVTVDAREFERVFRHAGESSIITLTIGGEEKQALIHEVQWHPVTGSARHIDFYITEADRALQVSVPLEFDGTAPAVKELGGTLVKVLHELDIEAKPDKLPSDITVDVSGLKQFGDQIHAGDLKLPEGVTLATDPEEVVVLVSEGTEEAEEEPTETPDLDSIEVEQRGKAEEGSEEGAGDEMQ